MKLCAELIADALSREDVQITFPDLGVSAAELAGQKACEILEEIRDIVADASLSDGECFLKIEAIVALLEKNGIGCNKRHDFG
ncbi:MAG: hypothetical protein ACI4XQ_08075 [Eubacteriales bacterium]